MALFFFAILPSFLSIAQALVKDPDSDVEAKVSPYFQKLEKSFFALAANSRPIELLLSSSVQHGFTNVAYAEIDAAWLEEHLAVQYWPDVDRDLFDLFLEHNGRFLLMARVKTESETEAESEARAFSLDSSEANYMAHEHDGDRIHVDLSTINSQIIVHELSHFFFQRYFLESDSKDETLDLSEILSLALSKRLKQMQNKVDVASFQGHPSLKHYWDEFFAIHAELKHKNYFIRMHKSEVNVELESPLMKSHFLYPSVEAIRWAESSLDFASPNATLLQHVYEFIFKAMPYFQHYLKALNHAGKISYEDAASGYYQFEMFFSTYKKRFHKKMYSEILPKIFFKALQDYYQKKPPRFLRHFSLDFEGCQLKLGKSR